jgi:hypothetical protein
MSDKPMDPEATKALYRQLRAAFAGPEPLAEALMETMTADELRDLARLLLARLLAAGEVVDLDDPDDLP